MGSAIKISDRYEILGAVPKAGGRSYHARHAALGHTVMVHFLPRGANAQNGSLLQRILDLPETERRLFIDAAEHDSVPFVVSWPLPEFETLSSWLERAGLPSPASQMPSPAEQADASPPHSPAAMVSAAEESKPKANTVPAGDFTKMFAPESLAVAPDPSPISQPAAREPGEFTKMFGPGSVPGEPASAPASMPPVSDTPPKLTSPADPYASLANTSDPNFTKIFANQSVEPSSWGGLEESTPGDLTKLFSAVSAHNADVLPPPQSTASVRQPEPTTLPRSSAPGDLTALFEGRGTSPQLGMPPAGTGLPNSAPVGVPPLPAVPPMPKVSVPPLATALPQPVRKPGNWPVWIGLALLFLLAVSLVLYFSLKK